MENYTTSSFQRQIIGQMVSKLGGTFQDTSSTTWKRILVSKPTRRATQEVHQCEILEEVFFLPCGKLYKLPKGIRPIPRPLRRQC